MDIMPAKNMQAKTTVNAAAQGTLNLETYMMLMSMPRMLVMNHPALSGAYSRCTGLAWRFGIAHLFL
jgi:hypothetical protein